MADSITDEELLRELQSFGETVKLPIKSVKRGVLIKKLNHLRVKAEKSQAELFKKPAPVGRGRRGARSPRSPIGGFSSDESDVGDPESQDRVTGKKKLQTANRRSSSRLTALVDSGIGKTAVGKQIKGNEANSNSLPVDRSEVRGRKSVGSVIPSSSTAATDGGSSASSVGIGLSNIGRSIFPTWSKNTNHKTRSFDFDSSDSDVGESSTYEAQSRGINTTFSYDERDDVNMSNERSPIGSTASTWLRNRKSLGTENSVKHHINSTPPRTSTPVTRRSFGRPSENHSPVTDQASIYQGQNSSPSAIRQQLNSTRENHFTAEKIAEDQRLQNVFKAKGKVSKTNYTQHISMMLVLILGLFFLLLGILYISMKTDSSDLPMSDSKTENDLLICTQWQKAMAKREEAEEKKRPCFEESVSLLAFKSISPLYDELSHRLSNYKCQKSSVGNMSRSDLTSFLDGFLQQQEVKGQKGHMYADVVISLVIHNPHWRIRAMKSEKEAASDMTEAEGVLYLESTVPGFMSLPCRLRNAVRRVTTQILIAVAILVFLAAAGAVTVYFVHYRVKHQEQQQKLVYDMVEKIIDVLRLHCETLHDEEEDKPYLAIQHVRDTLIAPAQRREYQAVWDKAVKFVELHESRVRVETQTIHGEDFTVWRWLQNCPKGQKVWQGQAFGEDKLNHVAKSPSPCLKVSNMFNADKENAGDWDVSVKDAILEKCADCQIVHIHVDRGSNEGVVYVKCSDEVHAGKAFKQLHGWWFDGKLVTVKYLKLEHYSRSFPRSAASSELLQPTTDRKLSLAQPFHSSSLEMT